MLKSKAVFFFPSPLSSLRNLSLVDPSALNWGRERRVFHHQSQQKKTKKNSSIGCWSIWLKRFDPETPAHSDLFSDGGFLLFSLWKFSTQKAASLLLRSNKFSTFHFYHYVDSQGHKKVLRQLISLPPPSLLLFFFVSSSQNGETIRKGKPKPSEFNLLNPPTSVRVPSPEGVCFFVLKNVNCTLWLIRRPPLSERVG